MYANIQKWGNNQAVCLPKMILDALSLAENDRVEITTDSDIIIIKKDLKNRRAKKSLAERFSDYNGDYKCTEYDWGKPQGKEVW